MPCAIWLKPMRCKKLFDRFFSLFFPDRCAFCNQVMSYQAKGLCICNSCKETLVLLSDVPTCRICGRRLSEDEELCDICRTHSRHFDRAISCLTYEYAVRDSILKFKFNKRIDHSRTYSALIFKRISPLFDSYAFDFVVCAPLSKKSLSERGYNQAEEIAQPVAEMAKIPFLRNAFSKIKETPKQSTLGYLERFKNVDGTFSLNIPKPDVRDKTFLLIDDVLTTGATADALSLLLKKAGAKRVIVGTVASTEPDRPDKKAPIDWKELTF